MTKKKWGQHFLINPKIIKTIIDTAKVKFGDSILEIGPGSGVLTEALLDQNSYVKSIEIDPKWCIHLKKRFKKEKKFTLLEKDVLEIPENIFSKIVPEKSKVVANLPYNIVTPFLLKILPIRKTWVSLTLMVQKEVADRICANPNSGKNFGPLSLVGELGFYSEKRLIITPENFKPKPKVDSALITLVPKQSALSNKKEKLFLSWSHLLFQQRRKTLVNGIKHHFPNWYKKCDNTMNKILGKRRPENLEFNEWIELFKCYQKNER